MSWSTTSVGALIECGHAEVKTGPFGTQLKASDYVEKGTPVINVRNIGFGSIRPNKLEYIPEEVVTRLSTHLLRRGDIVFGRKGAVERHVYIRSAQDRWFQGSDCLRLRLLSEGVALSKYLSFTFLTQEHQSWMMQQCSHGATMASLNQDIIKRIPLRIPPLDQQAKIVNILSTYDDLIDNNSRRIEILEEMARRLYEEWFVHFRFPGHEEASFKENEQGRVPEGWDVKPVADTFQILGGGTPSKKVPEYWDEGHINWFSPTDLTRSSTSFVEESSSKITNLGLKKSSAKLFPAYSVMMTSRATIGVVAINTQPASTNQGFITCLPSGEFPCWLMFHWLKENVERFISLGTGATFKEISKGVFKEIQLVVPSRLISGAFEESVAPMMKQVEILQRKNRNLRVQRDLLLPKLVSGEIDVSKLPMPHDKEVQAA